MSEQTSQDPQEGSRTPAGMPQMLTEEVQRELRRWRVATFNYGVTYYVSRILLIVSSAVVAAGQNLESGRGAWLIDWIPALALGVAVLTALDTWLQPQAKWRGFMESRDALADLLVQAENGLPAEATRAKLFALRKRHRERNIF